MAHVTDYHAASIRYTCLDRACMCMHVWNVSVANKQQGWDVDLSQPRQSRPHREFQFCMCEVLRIGKQNLDSSAFQFPQTVKRAPPFHAPLCQSQNHGA